jgi:Zn-dependent M28 family amino/carboxypeptidase
MKKIIAGAAALIIIGGCATVSHTSEQAPQTVAIDSNNISEITRTLASEEFQGRAMGTPGEERTVAYLIGLFQSLGLEPGGENGGWTQRVPLIRTKIQPGARFTIASGGVPRNLSFPDDIYVSTVRPLEEARIRNAPMVFVGYGVHAPEREWDDFKGVDLKGKVAVFLVNDPDFEASAEEPVAGRFGGQSMTYYGRWTYKFEEATRRGAVAALVIHETEAAGYGWNVVESPGGENYNIILPEGALQPPILQGWIQRPVAVDLLRAAGHDFEEVKKQARTAAFRPIDLGAAITAEAAVKLERIESQNVLAKISGRYRPDETVMYAAHWDSFGFGPPDVQGRRMRPGAIDNAIGVAAVVELARIFKAQPPPDRTLVFAAWTAEERGLLGAEHYAANPIYPHEKMAANLTLDVLQTAGQARDVVLIGAGQNELEDYLARFAALQGRSVTPETHPERGLFYRSDHFALAKQGVPVLLMMALGGGSDLIDGGREAGERWLAEYMTNCYHQPCDEWRADWDLTGAVQDIALLYEIGRDLALGRKWPGWKAGSEFNDLRARSEVVRR